ncbi:MAG: hypothetical protein K2X48_03630 [Chitinophagaceae bacterium]|nr:hypothetical protein [Chitinophagaceae bacterium]
MQKFFTTAAFVLLLHFLSNAQKHIWADSFQIKTTGVDLYNDLLKLHDPVLFISPLPQVAPLPKRNIPLKEGEGKKGFWLEGNIMHRFVIARWNEHHRQWWQRNRFTFDAGITTRMTRDSSSPLLPNNNRFGLGWDYLLHPVERFSNTAKAVAWLTAQVHHYSNGQADNFFLSTAPLRNNYRSGDFSANYFRLLIQRTKRSAKDNLYTAGAGFQREINIGGPLVLSDELKNFYGRSRLLLNYQWIRHPQDRKRVFKNKSGIESYNNPSPKKWMIYYRTEMNYILDNVSLYPYSSKYRLGWYNYFCYFFNTDNELGLMALTYLGRDYLNIRFDDPVFIAGIGIVIRPGRK